MGREIHRVPLDFDWPIDKQPWKGYVMPDELAHELPCPANCDNGYSPRASELHKRWYGYVPFDPAETGSTPYTEDTPQVRAFAESHVERSPGFYGTGDQAIRREARRLADIYNGSWSYHLAQVDVDALLADGRLMDFTHTFTRETRWQPRDPMPQVTAEQVNAWAIGFGLGHDAINADVVIRAACEREGVGYVCPACDGHGSVEAYEGQREAQEAWTRTDPPTGDGWQLWETVSEGKPISPVFATAEELATWMSSRTEDDRWFGVGTFTYEQALAFIKAGWAPSIVETSAGVQSGAQFVGSQTDE